MKNFSQISSDSFYKMENYHQISIDLIEEAEQLINSEDEKTKQIELLGALSYNIDIILEIFNPIYEIEISDLKDVLIHIENKIKELKSEL